MQPALRLLNAAGQQALKQGAKRDPELFILGSIMAVAIGGAGFYFGSNPTSSDSKHADDTFGKRNWGRWEHTEKEAPSALHSVIIPNVNLPKELHEKFNKFGKDF